MTKMTRQDVRFSDLKLRPVQLVTTVVMLSLLAVGVASLGVESHPAIQSNGRNFGKNDH